MEYQKVKSVAKEIHTKSPRLNKLVLDTLKKCSDLVGATLGPGGMPILIESQEHGFPPKVSKDGVTVFKSVGFDEPTAQVIMEAARDASVRTANEAGDGTTTATILAEAITRLTSKYLEDNKDVSPQRVMSKLQEGLSSVIEPMLDKFSIKPDFGTEEGKLQLWSVANISANGDGKLADAVLACFAQVGDNGNVTIQEVNGKSGYEVERIEGYPVPMGYEDSCMKFASKFINDPGNQRTVMENPVFVVYHGRLLEIQTIIFLMEKIAAAWQSEEGWRHNVVVVATGFSESVIAQLAMNFVEATTINVFPLLAPMTGTVNSQLGFLEDMCAFTGSELFDPLNKPLDKAELDQLGSSVKTFEVNRFRSVVIGDQEDVNAADRINRQVDILQSQKKQVDASIYDKTFFEERIGKLTGGIAKLRVVGASNGDLRERRDRVEDAVCAVRGAMTEGFLPGGGWTLLKLAAELRQKGEKVYDKILAPALEVPVERILFNCGMLEPEVKSTINDMIESGQTYNAADKKMVEPFTGGLYDSTPAVRNAIRNSLSIAKLLGLLGGTSVFKRDLSLERKEASDTNSFLRDANVSENPANDRP